MAALESVKSQGLEGLEALLTRQGEIMAAIAREKGELKPYLDQWEGLPAPERARLRAGRPGEILDALEGVAKGIQARHQAMFGDCDQRRVEHAALCRAGQGPRYQQPDMVGEGDRADQLAA